MIWVRLGWHSLFTALIPTASAFSFFFTPYFSLFPLPVSTELSKPSPNQRTYFPLFYPNFTWTNLPCISLMLACTSLRPTFVRVQTTHASLITACAHLGSIQPHWLHLRFRLFFVSLSPLHPTALPDFWYVCCVDGPSVFFVFVWTLSSESSNLSTKFPSRLAHRARDHFYLFI